VQPHAAPLASARQRAFPLAVKTRLMVSDAAGRERPVDGEAAWRRC